MLFKICVLLSLCTIFIILFCLNAKTKHGIATMFNILDDIMYDRMKYDKKNTGTKRNPWSRLNGKKRHTFSCSVMHREHEAKHLTLSKNPNKSCGSHVWCIHANERYCKLQTTLWNMLNILSGLLSVPTPFPLFVVGTKFFPSN